MKSRIAAALSLSGVLVAGSAAALVNTQVLNDDTTASAEAATTTVATVPTTLPASTVPGPGTTPATTAVVAAVPAAGTGAPAPASTQAIYQIGDSGFVTLDTAGDVLTIIAATPNPGWSVTEAESDGRLHIEVKFQAGSIEVEFKANLLFGVVTTSVESSDLSAPPAAGTSTSNSAFDDDDDDDDDEESEDHEDEDEEGDDD